MDENATPDPSPFRRFPWLQLAFCVACLGMTAWMWMRYSYAWEVTPASICGQQDRIADGRWPDMAFVRVRGKTECEDRVDNGWSLYMVSEPQGTKLLSVVAPQTRGGAHLPETFRGRLRHTASGLWQRGPVGQTAPRTAGFVLLDGKLSRFHPTSIGGLVVGAMGCFIFGLYLRRWLRERNAALTTETQGAQRTTRTRSRRSR